MELELENLDINDDPLELDCGDEAEDLTKKLLDEQGKKKGTGLGSSLLFPYLSMKHHKLEKKNDMNSSRAELFSERKWI